MQTNTTFDDPRDLIPFISAGLAGICVVLLFWPTASSIIRIWSVSETFTHGYFVIPVFLWLVWRKRTQLPVTERKPDLRALIFVALAGAMWLLSKLSGIQVGEQLALALILVFTLWAVLGQRIAGQLKFPLVFLLFLAPVGEELVPVLMELTADITVWAVRNTGVPVFREGLYFSLPSGDWSVVEACSGIRYLIASAVLGSLYAYLSYSSLRMQFFFFAISLIVPIIANSIRAYLIVMLGHFSGNRLATGVDHLVYGWVFFGIVMFALFSIGTWLIRFDSKNESIKPEDEIESGSGSGSATRTTQHLCLSGYAKTMVIIFAAVASWPAWSTIIDARAASSTSKIENAQLLPESQIISPEIVVEPTVDLWQPHNMGHDLQLNASYKYAGLPDVRALAFVYERQQQGKEMISSSNVLARSQQDVWRLLGVELRNIKLHNGIEIDVKEHILTAGNRRLVVWQWYAVGQTRTSSKLHVKFLEMRDQLFLRKSLSTNYMLVIEGNGTVGKAALTGALQRVIGDGDFKS